MQLELWACVTTKDRSEDLDLCLAALWSSTRRPRGVVVSDDSPDPATRRRNQEVVRRHPGTTYLVGPMAGVCANRNRAVDAVPPSPAAAVVSFIDDDVSVAPDFIERGLSRYALMAEGERSRTILSGVSSDRAGRESVPGRLSFRGHFRPSSVPESVAIPAAMFPRALFRAERWDERIIFGYEDAELCLRALNRGYRIRFLPEMRVLDRGSGESTLHTHAVGRLTDYDLCVEAARLYVGIKRYRKLTPSRLRLVAFVGLYAVHMTVFLLRKGALPAWPEILRRAVRRGPTVPTSLVGGSV